MASSDATLFAMCIVSSVASILGYGLLSMRYDLGNGGLLVIVLAIAILSILKFGEGYLTAG